MESANGLKLRKNKKNKASQCNLLIIQALVLILPSLSISYVFFKSNIALESSQISILLFTVILVVCALLIIRQVFEKLLKITGVVRMAGCGEAFLADTKNATQELQTLSVGFSDIMNRFQKTANDLEQRAFELSTIKDLTDFAAKSLDIDYLLELLLDKSMVVSTSRTGSIFMVEPGNKRFRVVVSKGSDFNFTENSYIDIDKSPVQDVTLHKRPLIVEDIKTECGKDYGNFSQYCESSFISMPIFIRENLVAVLNMGDKETGQPFCSNDIAILSIMIAQIASALENAMLHLELAQQLEKLKKRTQQLSDSNDQLQKEIYSYHQLQEEKKGLEEQLLYSRKMESMGTIAGGVAHDLNNVLSGIVAYPDLILHQIPEDSPIRKLLLTIRDSGNKAAAIVQDLLTLARRGVVVEEIVSLNDIILEYLNSPGYEKLRSFHPNIEVETNLEEALVNVIGSPVHIFQVVMNLISNAAESITGDGKICISTQTRYIRSGIKGCDKVEEGDYVVLSVSDSGTGISAEDMEKIFEPFYTKKVMGRSGTGLGMTVVKGTVKDHRGYIEINSKVGYGTEISVLFPATRKEKVTQEDIFIPQDYMGKGESILVVDDVKEQREIALSLLQELSYEVTCAPSGEDAVEYLKEKSADLVLLDMNMDPGIDGLETYKKSLELNPQQKAIIVSGFSETERIKEAGRLGARKYIQKPYTIDKIGIAIRNELDEKPFMY